MELFREVNYYDRNFKKLFCLHRVKIHPLLFYLVRYFHRLLVFKSKKYENFPSKLKKSYRITINFNASSGCYKKIGKPNVERREREETEQEKTGGLSQNTSPSKEMFLLVSLRFPSRGIFMFNIFKRV